MNELISLNESNQNKIRWLYYKYPNELKKVFHVRKSIEEKPSTAEFIEQEICDCFRHHQLIHCHLTVKSVCEVIFHCMVLLQIFLIDWKRKI